MSPARVVDGHKVRGHLTRPPEPIGSTVPAASLRIVAGGREVGITVTDSSASAALLLQPGDYVVAEGTFFTWPSKPIDELWGTVSAPLMTEEP
jgi:hypothetical protein